VKIIQILCFENKEKDVIEENKVKDSLFKSYTRISNYFKKIIDFNDAYFSLEQLFNIYSLVSIINYVNEKLILLIIMNIIIFYFPIESRTDHFLFKIYMAIKQTYEGIIGLVIVIIPKFEKNKENVKENEKEKEKQA